MANIKEFKITADVPSHWVTDLDAKDLQRIASLTQLTPFGEGRLAYTGHQQTHDNDKGGITRTHQITIDGISSCAWQCLKAVCDSLLTLDFANIQLAEARDIEGDDGPWESLVESTKLGIQK
jgi:hypothetical protein